MGNKYKAYNALACGPTRTTWPPSWLTDANTGKTTQSTPFAAGPAADAQAQAADASSPISPPPNVTTSPPTAAAAGWQSVVAAIRQESG